MSQKINPISFRLGLSQVWDTTFAVYGGNFNSYQFVLTKLMLEKYVQRIFKKYHLLLGSSYWIITQNKLVITINYSEPEKLTRKSFKLKNYLIFLCTRWTNVPTKIYLFKQTTWLNSAELALEYTSLLLKNVSLKKALKDVAKLITIQLNSKKILYTSKGPLTFKLQGFKIKSSGRFDNSRNQMSKTIKYTKGSLPLSKLNSYVEYSHKDIHTKSGVCSVHIWLFYVT